jgi:hypothetical protein
VITFLAYSLVPAAIGFAILGYRLYDNDRIVSRTVSYAVITALLAGVYVGCVALLTDVRPFSGEAGTAASVLAAVALFGPLRRRVQQLDGMTCRLRADGPTGRAERQQTADVSSGHLGLAPHVQPVTWACGPGRRWAARTRCRR